MARQSSLGILVGALAVAAAPGVVMQVRRAPRAAADTVVTASSAVAPPAARLTRARYPGAGDLLREFQGDAPGRGDPVGVLIATLPDPIDSHMDWAFDADFEALRRAHEAGGWILDRFVAPWQDDRSAALRRLPGDSLGFRRQFPGVILFRPTDPRDRTLRLLFLVLETPTAGVHKAALRAALAERDSLAAAGRLTSADRDTLRIVGPTFSGSATSLRITLDGWRARGASGVARAARIITGSATAWSAAQTLSDSAAGTPLLFSATVHPDTALAAALVTPVLQRLRLRPERVAILRESSTQYGASQYGPAREGMASAGARDARGYLVIPFPMNVSSLRSEYAKQLPAGADAGAAPSSRVPLNLQDPTTTAELPHAMSALTPAAVDILLDEIAQTLVANRVRAVGLLATDVRDKLFLGVEIRKRVRDVQLFTFESTALLLRPDYNQYLRGMLVFSSYPLFLQSQWWSAASGGRPRLVFASNASEGIFNAALLHLGRTSAVVDYADPWTKGDTLRPPMWMTVVGRSSMLPVIAARAPAELERYVAGVPAEAAPAGDGRLTSEPAYGAGTMTAAAADLAVPTGGLLPFHVSLLLLCCVGLAAYLYWEARGQWRTQGYERPPGEAVWPLVPPAGESTRPYREYARWLVWTPRAATTDETEAAWRPVFRSSLTLHREIYTAMRVIAVAMVLVPVSLFLVQTSQGTAAARPGLARLAPLFLTAAGLYLAARSVVRILITSRRYLPDGVRYAFAVPWGTAGERWMWRIEVVARSLVLPLGLGVAAALALLVRDIAMLPLLDARVFFQRALQINSGVSPMLPLMIAGAGFAGWCWWHLQRIRCLSTTTAFEEAARTKRAIGDPGQLQAAVRHVREGLFLLVPRGALPLALTIILLAVPLWEQFDPSLEVHILPIRFGRLTVFDVLLRFSVIGTLAATAWAVYRFAAVWYALRDCLGQLATTPLITAFERLPRRVSQLTRLTPLQPAAAPMLRAITETQWSHLRNLFDESTFKGTRAADDALIERVKAFVASGWAPVHRRPIWLPAPEAGLDALFGILGAFWEAEPASANIKTAAEEVAKTKPADDAQRSTSGHLRRHFSDGARLWLREAEELAAVQTVDYLEWVLRHLRNLACFLLLSLCFTAGLLTSYPIQPQSVARLIFLLLVGATAALLVTTLNQMNRDEILSRIAKTDPGRITWDAGYILNIILFAAVPLMAAFGTDFPFLREGLFAWLQPLLTTLTRQ